MRRRELKNERIVFYKRRDSHTIFVRDIRGRYKTYRETMHGVRPLPGGITKLPSIFGRVDFTNFNRFTGFVRSQTTLHDCFEASARKLNTNIVPLPGVRSYMRRLTRQGMDDAMISLTGSHRSATEYVNWFTASYSHHIPLNEGWEWCHLLAHSMGGADNERNVVAARRGNNTEQLAIESALHMYRSEGIFTLNITAACVDRHGGMHIGDVIKYEVSCIYHGAAPLVIYLDCLRAPKPSQHHFYHLLEMVASWANKILVMVSQQMYREEVDKSDRRAIILHLARF
jgi:hypothetical protein